MLANCHAHAVLCLGAVSCLAGGACTGEGAVEIALVFPDQASLSPRTSGPTELTLFYGPPGKRPSAMVSTIEDPGSGLTMGRLGAGAPVHLAVALRSSTQRLVGYGRAAAPVEVLPGQVTTVSLPMRRPFVYITGGPDITVIDAARDASEDTTADTGYLDAIADFGPAEVVVPTYDGTALVVVAGSADERMLYLVSTSNHRTVLQAPIPLDSAPAGVDRPAVDAAVSASGRHVAIARGGEDGGVTIVDLKVARAGGPAVRFVPLGPVGRVAIPEGGTGRVFALVGRAQSLDCADPPAARILSLDLDLAEAPPEIVPYDGPAHDLAASAGGDTLVIADGCGGQLVRLDTDGGGGASGVLAVLPGASTVALWNERVWAVGTVRPDELDTTAGARLRVLSLDLRGDVQGLQQDEAGDISPAPPSTIDLPPMTEQVVTPVFTEPGQTVLQQVGADALHAFDLAVTPGADAIAILIEGRYLAAAQGDLFDTPVLPAMDVRTHEYLLVDTATATLVQRVRTRCELSVEPEDAVVSEWECAATGGLDALAAAPYVPRAISVLYGS